MLPQRGTSVSIVSFVRGIVKTQECGLGELGRRSRGWWGISLRRGARPGSWGGVGTPTPEGGHGLLHPGGERMVVDWALSFVLLTEFSEGPVSSLMAGRTCPPWTLVSSAPGRCGGRKH